MNSFGSLFRISLFGESHGESIGVVIDGCPAGLSLSEATLLPDLARRQSGALGTTARCESDKPHFLSGLWKGKTTAAPIAILFHNQNIRSQDYNDLASFWRPGHADFTAAQKYGSHNDYRGGGHFSGRLTLALVAAGSIAKLLLPQEMQIQARLLSAGGSTDIETAVEAAMLAQDSIGGMIACEAQPMPIGWGEPFFGKLQAQLGHLLFSIPAVKGVAFGSGMHAAHMRGSQHNDPILNAEGKTATNHAGGINGGISNGNPLCFEVAVKPPSSIAQTQQSYHTAQAKVVKHSIQGRHDACIALRMPVIVEAATAIVLADLMLQHKARQ